jgi:signal transduction histidine kinase
MNRAGILNLFVKIIAWIARIWSILIAIFLLLDIIFSDPGNAGANAAADNIMLSLTGLALLGLFLAWRWVRFGSFFTLAALFLQELAGGMLKGDWLVGLILGLLIAPAAVLFLIARGLEKWAMKSQVV